MTVSLLDIRLAWRTARAHAWSYCATIVALGLCLSLGSTVTSAIASIFGEAFPYETPSELVLLWASEAEDTRRGIAPPDFVDLRVEATSLTAVAALVPPVTVSLSGTENDLTSVLSATPELFQVLGVDAQAGRTLIPEDEGRRVTVISYGMWQDRFGGGDQVGQSLGIDGANYLIVGVMPEGFFFPDVDVQAWIPLDQERLRNTPRGVPFLQGVGRLAPGATVADLNKELALIFRQLETSFPATNKGVRVSAFAMFDVVFSSFREATFALGIAVAVLLLLAGLTLGQHLVSTSISRRSEMLIRRACGAPPGVAFQQVAIEGFLVILPASMGAVAGSHLLMLILRRSELNDLPGIATGSLDWRAIIAISLGSAACLVIGALLPTFTLGRTSISQLFRQVPLASVQRPQAVTRWILVLALSAAAGCLASGAITLSFIFSERARSDWGFTADNVILVDTRIRPAWRRDLRAQQELGEGVLDELQAIPLVVAAGMAHSVPIRWGAWTAAPVAPAGGSVLDSKMVTVLEVGRGYFKALGARLLAGREFDQTETTNSERTVVVSQSLATLIWPNLTNPVGKAVDLLQYRMEGEKIAFDLQKRLMNKDRSLLRDPSAWQRAGGGSWTVVGVVADIKMFGIESDPAPTIYINHLQVYPPIYAFSGAETKFLVRPKIGVGVTVLAPLIKQAVQRVDSATTFELVYLRDLVNRSIGGRGNRRLLTFSFVTFSLVALCLSMVAAYAFTFRTMRGRIHEMGIRLALGAQPGQLVRQAMLQIGVASFLGTVVGAGLWLMGSRLLDSALSGTPAYLNWIGSLLAIGLIVAGVELAAWQASRTALRVNPATLLRSL